MNKKALIERRNALKAKMSEIITKAKTETRALSSDEVRDFDAAEAEIRNINSQLNELKNKRKGSAEKMPKLSDVEKREYKAFAKYIRSQKGDMETRAADSNMTMGANGAVVPETIANKIIQKVDEICPIYKLATKYDSKGTIEIPLENTEDGDITVGFQAEFAELVSSSNSYTSISLSGYLYGALTKVSKSLINNSDFKLVNFVINRMAFKIAKFLENICLNGYKNEEKKVDVSGVAGSYDKDEMEITFANAGKITADELIDLQELIPDVYQSGCIWIMNKATRKIIRKLKDGQGNYLLEKDFTARWGWKLLGNDVYITDSVAKPTEAGKIAVHYGDYSGLAVKETEAPEIEVLDKNFFTQHAIGVCAWGEVDAAVENTQKVACGVMPAVA